MITVTKLDGSTFAINPDLVERVCASPDSTITMVSGVRYVVCEPVDRIIDRIVDYRARVLAATRVQEISADHAGTAWGER